MSSATNNVLDESSPLATLLSYAQTQPAKDALDFSSLDASTFDILNQACSQILQTRTQDSDLRLSLAAKNKELHSKLDRLQNEHDAIKDDLDAAQRGQQAAKALQSQTKSQLDDLEANRKQVLQDLAQARRECLAVKAVSHHHKQIGERALARQRERFADSAIAAARAQSQQIIVLPGVFDSPETNALPAECATLERQQIAELESQRLALLSSNAALRRLCSDAINFFSAAASSFGAVCPPNHLQSDLFPQGEPLRKDYVMSSKQGNHPAVRVLSTVQQAADKALRDQSDCNKPALPQPPPTVPAETAPLSKATPSASDQPIPKADQTQIPPVKRKSQPLRDSLERQNIPQSSAKDPQRLPSRDRTTVIASKHQPQRLSDVPAGPAPARPSLLVSQRKRQVSTSAEEPRRAQRRG